MLAIGLHSIRADRLEGLGACHFATWQDGGLAVSGQCLYSWQNKGLAELAIVLPGIMADTLKHVIFLPGKMAAWLFLANVVECTLG